MTSIALARVYQQSFESHPHYTLALTNGALSAFGDAVAQGTQNVIQSRNGRDTTRKYDFPRTLRFFAFGFGMGPLIGRWNVFLERHFPLRFQGIGPSTSAKTGKVSLRALSKRVAADQLLMAPIGLAMFLGSMSVMEGRGAAHLRKKYSDLYKPALLANWQVWPVAQLVNFRFMPLPYRVPFQSTCGVFWTLYLSLLNSKEDEYQDRTARNERMRNTIK